MKRTDITALFPEATEDQINALMNLNGADINAAKKGMTDLQSQLAAAQTDLKKLQEAPKPSDDLEKRLEEAQNALAGMKQAEAARLMREKIAGEKKVPVSLLTGDSEEACMAQADALLDWRGEAAPRTPNFGVDHLLGNKPGTGGSVTDAAFAELRDGLFQES